MIKRETQSFDATYKTMDDKIAFLKLFDLVNLQKAGKIGRISQKKMTKRSDAIKAIMAFDIKNKFLISKTMFNNPNEYQKIKADPNEEFNTMEWNQYLYDNMKTAEWSTIKDDLTAELSAYKEKEKEKINKIDHNKSMDDYEIENNKIEILSENESNNREMHFKEVEREIIEPKIFNQKHDIKLIHNEIKPIHHEHKHTYHEYKPIVIKKIEFSSKNNLDLDMKEDIKKEPIIEPTKNIIDPNLNKNERDLFLDYQKDIINEQLVIINQQKKIIDECNKFINEQTETMNAQTKALHEELKLLNEKLETFRQEIKQELETYNKNKKNENQKEIINKTSTSSTTYSTIRKFPWRSEKIMNDMPSIPLTINNKSLSKVSQTSQTNQTESKQSESITRDELERFILEKEYAIKAKNKEKERIKRLSKIIANSKRIAIQHKKNEMLKNQTKTKNVYDISDVDYSKYVQYLSNKFKKNM